MRNEQTQLTGPTSERLFRLLLLGLKRTSLKSSLRSASTRGILNAPRNDDQDDDGEYAEVAPPRKTAAAVVVAGPKPQPPNPSLKEASVFIAKRDPAQSWPPCLYFGPGLSLSPLFLSFLSLQPRVPPPSAALQLNGRSSSG